MADKAFGVKQLNIIGTGTPTIESPGDLSLKAGTVAISTNLYVGGITTHIGLTTTTNDLYVGLGYTIHGNGSQIYKAPWGHDGLSNYLSDYQVTNPAVAAYGSSISGNWNVVAGYFAACCGTSMNYNVIFGESAGRKLTSGSRNILIGSKTGCVLDDAQQNIIIGSCAGGAATGSYNVALGMCASCKVTGDYNIAIGLHAAENVTVSCRNIAIGKDARNDVGAGGTDNVFLGTYAGATTADLENGIGIGPSAHRNVQGDCNVAIGNEAMFGTAMGEGYDNIALGAQAGYELNNGSNNIFLGKCSGAKSTNVSHNIFMGCGTGCCTTAGSYNVYLGHETGKCNQGGACNVYIGNRTGFAATGGEQNVAIGQSAGYNNNIGSYNIFFGSGAGTNNDDANKNVLIGQKAGFSNTTGQCNVFVGAYAGCKSDSSGSHNLLNVAIGHCAGFCNAGDRNIAIGWKSGWMSESGEDNVIIGSEAGHCINSGADNVLIGMKAGFCQTGANSNVFVGCCAGYDASSGGGNVALGGDALKVVHGNYNTGLGFAAGDDITTGSRNIAIGCNVQVPSATGDAQLAIGSGSDTWINGDSNFDVGIGTATPTSKLHVVGDFLLTGIATAVDFDSTSDIRYKKNIQAIEDPISKVVSIEGVSFNWKADDRAALGVIADQVETVLPELVRGTDPKTVNYNGLIGLLIEAVKEQQIQIDKLNERISKLE